MRNLPMTPYAALALLALTVPLSAQRQTSSPDRGGRNGLSLAVGDIRATPVERIFDPATQATAKAAFERLKSLAGEWRGVSVGSTASASIRVTARGSAVIERILVEDPVEMYSVYTLDRGQLVLTHYCAAGNQPRMYLDRKSTPDELRFSFLGASNLKSRNDFHMHELVIRLRGDSAATWEWISFRGSKAAERDRIELQRSGTK